MTPIGQIQTPYKDKFAVPRQPGLVKSAVGSVIFSDDFSDPNSLRGIEEFSHLWLLFEFHKTAEQGWSPMVRPPRLGGNKKVGVFASRTTFRPNPIGMSVVEFVSVEHSKGQLTLNVRGIDLVNGTPILDIKPYIPYADAHPDANGSFADSSPDSAMSVSFSRLTQDQMLHLTKHTNLRQLIVEVLAQDPRPAYQNLADSSRIYGMHLYDFNIRWMVENGVNQVVEVTNA